jgi:hypothetical protein
LCGCQRVMEVGRLSVEQVSQFRSDGYLIVRGFVEPPVLESWREQFWARHAAAGARRDDPGTWPCIGTEEEDKWMPLQPLFGDLPQVRQTVAQLGGGDFVPGTRPGERTDMMIATLPGTINRLSADGKGTSTRREPGGDKKERQMPHIDGAAKHRGSPGVGMMLGATTYLYDVEEAGGSFCFWPETHLATHRYFIEHPEKQATLQVSFEDVFGADWRAMESIEFTAKAGTAVFWHSLIFHSGSVNSAGLTPRLGLFARWHSKAMQHARFPVDDMWRAWDCFDENRMQPQQSDGGIARL